MPASSSAVRDTVLAAFAADSLSLGAHWEYSADTILKTYNGKLAHLAAPIASYHAGKKAGQQTHIGDNAVFLLEFLAAAPDHRFDVDAYLQYWRSKWDVDTPPAYVDHATKTALEGLRAGKTGTAVASTDDDLAHSSKFFPLLAVYRDEEQLVQAVRALVSQFQSGPHENITGEWLARVAFRVLHGREKPSAAIAAVTAQINDSWLTERVKEGQASSGQDDLAALRSFGDKKTYGTREIYTGLTCGVAHGLPAVVHYALKYEDAADPTQALIEDVSVGGNSNARSLAVATLLFSYRGIAGFKINELINGLQQRQHILDLLAKLPVTQS